MKKAFSILVAALILLSGMHLSVSSHFCGGEVASVKFSLSGEKATCGMEDSQSTVPTEKEISTNCCHNEEAVFIVDSNYNPTSFKVKEPEFKLFQVIAVPVVVSYSSNNSSTYYAPFSPPDKTIANTVNLADICVFRI